MRLSICAAAMAALAWAASPPVQAAPVFEVVGQSGSTSPVASVSVDGPAPWLYVGLDAPFEFLTWMTASLTHDPNPNDANPGIKLEASRIDANPAGTQLWYSPTEAAWEAARVPGTWQFETTFHAINLVCIYGVCAPLGAFESPGPVFSFGVGTGTPPPPPPVPEPQTWALMALGLAALSWRAQRRQPRHS